MLFLRALLLWALVSVHVVGAAFLFRRYFPRESRWLAFIVPGIVFVLLCNFVEYHLALPAFSFLLPVTTIGSIYLIGASKSRWRVMRLPTFLFLASFAFTMTLRVLRPDIANERDATSDISIVGDFLSGQTLPAESTWLAPVKLMYYYYLDHYAAAILTRWFGLDIGTGFNVSVALSSAYMLFFAGAVAWLLGRGRLWIAILCPVLTAFAATGLDGYLWLTMKNIDAENVINIHSLIGRDDANTNWFISKLTPVYIAQDSVLTPPLFGGWTGSFHSVQAAQFVICFALLALIEMLRRKRTNWPWICLLISPFLMLTTCTWGLPMIGFIVVVGLIVAVRMKIMPENLRIVVALSAGLAALLEPMLLPFLNWTPMAGFDWLSSDLRTQWPEFVGQWWPVYLPWLALLFLWKRLSAATRIVLVAVPIFYGTTEIWNYGWRGDMTAKTWGCIYAAAWIVFLPEIARQRAWPFRIILALLTIASVLSLCCWTTHVYRTCNWDDISRLDGLGVFRSDERKARMVQVLSRYENQIIIPGETDSADLSNALLPLFSKTRAYATWSFTSDCIFYSNGQGESARRAAMTNMLYKGTLPNPLYFLRQENIAAVVIYPEDNIDPAVVDGLIQKLAPYYTYDDACSRSEDQIDKNLMPDHPYAGVFIYHPEMATLLGPAKEIVPSVSPVTNAKAP